MKFETPGQLLRYAGRQLDFSTKQSPSIATATLLRGILACLITIATQLAAPPVVVQQDPDLNDPDLLKPGTIWSRPGSSK